jgi:methionyl-tRNA synthetase
MTSIDDFLKLDIRVGKIIGADVHEAAKKPMYVMKVDFGSEIGVRQIVAGIRAYYPAEDLIGKLVVGVVNLDTKKIAGVESQGMLLAAGSEEDGEAVISLLAPDRDMPLGSKIS